MALIFDSSTIHDFKEGSVCIFCNNRSYLTLNTPKGKLIVFYNSDMRYNNYMFNLLTDEPAIILHFSSENIPFVQYTSPDMYTSYKLPDKDMQYLINTELLSIEKIGTKPLRLVEDNELFKIKNGRYMKNKSVHPFLTTCKIVAVNEAAIRVFGDIFPYIQLSQFYYKYQHDDLFDTHSLHEWDKLSNQKDPSLHGEYNITNHENSFVATWEKVDLDTVFVLTKENVLDANLYEAIACCKDFFSHHISDNIFAFSMFFEMQFGIDFNWLSTYMVLELDIPTILHQIKYVRPVSDEMVKLMNKPNNGIFDGYCIKEYAKIYYNEFEFEKYDDSIKCPIYNGLIELRSICQQNGKWQEIIRCFSLFMYILLKRTRDIIKNDKETTTPVTTDQTLCSHETKAPLTID